MFGAKLVNFVKVKIVKMSQEIPEGMKLFESKKKSPYRKPKLLPANYEEIDKWQMPQVTKEQVKGPFLEESSFATLFPKYREKYLKEVIGIVQKALSEHGIKLELDLLEGSLTVKTTKKAFDPSMILKARDIIKLLARSVPYQAALRLLEDNTFCDIIKIKSLVPNKEKFVKRRARLIGANGETLKSLEILTECYIMVQGSTVSVIGHYKRLKQVRKIIEEVMRNIHPLYHIKELMIKRELEKDEKLKDEDWTHLLPQFRKTIATRKKIKKTVLEKKERALFPNPPQPRKEDIQMQTGEYFLSDQQKQEKKMTEIKAKQSEVKQKKIIEHNKAYQAPEESAPAKSILKKPGELPKAANVDVNALLQRFNIPKPN